MKWVQVFEWSEMPEPLREDWKRTERPNNNACYSWYPNCDDEDWELPDLKGRMNGWLLTQGMVEDRTDEYYYVLISVSW